MALKTCVADGGSDYWNEPSNWSPSGAPANGDDITYSHSATNQQYFNRFPNATTSGQTFVSGPTVTAQNTSTSINAARFFGIQVDSSAPNTPFDNYWEFPTTFDFTINYPNSPREGALNAAKSATAGSAWYCRLAGYGPGPINKRGNGYWLSANQNGILTKPINVYDGGLVVAEPNGFGSGYVNMVGDNTFFSTVANNVNYTIANSTFYLYGNSLRLGSYLTNTAGFTGSMTITNVVLRLGAGPVLKELTIAGKNVVATYLYHDGTDGNCGFRKYGTATLTISNNPPGNQYIVGPVVVTDGQIVVNADSVFRGATLYGSSGIVFNPTTNYIGNIADVSSFVSSFDLGGKVFNVGYANEDASYTGALIGTSAALLRKRGTGTWTLSGNNSGFSGEWGFYDGSVLAATSINALGGPGRTHDVQTTGQIQVASGHTVNNTGGTTYLRRTATDKGALYAASGAAGYTTGTVYLGVAQTPVEAAFGATLNVTASSVVSELSNHGLYKLGAGTVVLSSPSYTYTGSTTVAAGTLSATGSALGATPVALGDARLLNTQLGASTSLTIPTAFTTQATVESSVTSPDYANAVTIPTSSALTLKTENLAGGRPIPLLGTAPLNVSGALVAPIGSNQRGRLVHGGNLAFGAGSLLRFSTPTAPTTIGTQSVTGDLQLDAATPVVMDASVYTAAGTYTLFRWTGAFSAAAPYSSAGQEQAAVTARISAATSNPDLRVTAVTYAYGLNRIDVTLAANSTSGKQAITGDLQLDEVTPIILDASVYTAPDTYVLFAWTGAFTATGYSAGQEQAAVTERLQLTHSGSLTPGTPVYDATSKSIRVTLT